MIFLLSITAYYYCISPRQFFLLFFDLRHFGITLLKILKVPLRSIEKWSPLTRKNTLQVKYLLRKINVTHFSLGYGFIDAPTFMYMLACKYLQRFAYFGSGTNRKRHGRRLCCVLYSGHKRRCFSQYLVSEAQRQRRAPQQPVSWEQAFLLPPARHKLTFRCSNVTIFTSSFY